MADSVIINSVDRALDVILYMYKKGREVSVTEISNDLGVYKSTIFRTLATLQNKRFVMQDQNTGKYSLGVEFYIIGASLNNQSGLIHLVKPYAQKLNQEFNEAVNVSVLEKIPGGSYQSVIVYKEASYHGLNANTEVGSDNDCYCAAIGKCLLAFTPDIDFSVYKEHKMQKFTDKTITTISGLKKELAKVRENGYAMDDEEREKGLLCIGAPILMNGEALAAISISGPESRMRIDLDHKIEFVKSIGEKISLEISADPETW